MAGLASVLRIDLEGPVEAGIKTLTALLGCKK